MVNGLALTFNATVLYVTAFKSPQAKLLKYTFPNLGLLEEINIPGKGQFPPAADNDGNLWWFDNGGTGISTLRRRLNNGDIASLYTVATGSITIVRWNPNNDFLYTLDIQNDRLERVDKNTGVRTVLLDLTGWNGLPQITPDGGIWWADNSQGGGFNNVTRYDIATGTRQTTTGVTLVSNIVVPTINNTGLVSRDAPSAAGSVRTFGGNVAWAEVCGLSDTQAVVTWRGSDNVNVRGAALSISPTGTITVGSTGTIHTVSSPQFIAPQDQADRMSRIDDTHAIQVYTIQNAQAEAFGQIRVLTASGTTLTVGSASSFGDGTHVNGYIAVVMLTATVGIVAWQEGPANSDGHQSRIYEAVVTVSGTSVSVGSPTVVIQPMGASSGPIDLARISDTSAILSYPDGTPIRVICRTVSSSGSLGSAITVANPGTEGAYPRAVGSFGGTLCFVHWRDLNAPPPPLEGPPSLSSWVTLFDTSGNIYNTIERPWPPSGAVAISGSQALEIEWTNTFTTNKVWKLNQASNSISEGESIDIFTNPPTRPRISILGVRDLATRAIVVGPSNSGSSNGELRVIDNTLGAVSPGAEVGPPITTIMDYPCPPIDLSTNAVLDANWSPDWSRVVGIAFNTAEVWCWGCPPAIVPPLRHRQRGDGLDQETARFPKERAASFQASERKGWGNVHL